MSVVSSVESNNNIEAGLMGPVKEDFPERRSDVAVRAVEEETLVLDRHGQQVHQLNLTASYIWNRCDGRTPVAKIAEQLAEFFDVDSETAARDVSGTICLLRKLSLIVPYRKSVVARQC